MAQHESAKKRIRTTARRNEVNRSYRSSVRTAVKALRAAVAKKEDETKLTALLRQAQALLDKAAKKGLIHKNTASRSIGRLARYTKKATA